MASETRYDFKKRLMKAVELLASAANSIDVCSETAPREFRSRLLECKYKIEDTGNELKKRMSNG